MDKPAIIMALEADPRMIDYAGMAMYKIREPKGSKLRSFDHITVGKQNRNRELAMNVISQVLQRYPDPQQVRSVDEVKDYMADVMYRTLAPTKSEHFPLDQRTPFAKAYYREKAEGFFYDFLSPLAAYSKSGLPGPPSAQLNSGTAKSFPPISNPQAAKNLKPSSQKATPKHKAIAPSKKSTPVPAQTVRDHKPKVVTSVPEPQTSYPSQKSSETTPAESLSSLIGCLLMIVIVLLILLLIRTF